MGHGDIIGAAKRGGAATRARAVAPASPLMRPKMSPAAQGHVKPPHVPANLPGMQQKLSPLSRQSVKPGTPKPVQPVMPNLKPPMQSRMAPQSAAQRPLAPPVLQAKAALQAKSAPGQTRIYPNLRPLAQQSAPHEEIFSLQQWYGNYGMRGTAGRGHYVPNARYLFVRTTDGQTLMHPRLRHPVLASGEPVMYAGEAYFESGALRWWSNGSGHYRPDSDHAPQAGLPLDKFRTWDDVVRRGTRAPPQASS